MNKVLLETINSIKEITVTQERKDLLDSLKEFMQSKIDKKEAINLNFICTHNSRRSHLGQIWMQTLAHYVGLPNVYSYSGGTEATAMALPIVTTLQEQGFEIHKLSEEKNPVYAVKFDEAAHPVICFSKEYFNDFNPKSKFGAVLTCSSADKGCPFVAGTEKRMAITYEDPKLFDGTDQQDQKYKERSLQIASEIFYVVSALKF